MTSFFIKQQEAMLFFFSSQDADTRRNESRVWNRERLAYSLSGTVSISEPKHSRVGIGLTLRTFAFLKKYYSQGMPLFIPRLERSRPGRTPLPNQDQGQRLEEMACPHLTRNTRQQSSRAKRLSAVSRTETGLSPPPTFFRTKKIVAPGYKS